MDDRLGPAGSPLLSPQRIALIFLSTQIRGNEQQPAVGAGGRHPAATGRDRAEGQR